MARAGLVQWQEQGWCSGKSTVGAVPRAGLVQWQEQGWCSAKSRVGEVVRALAFHQSGLGLIPCCASICGLGLLVLYSVLRGFYPGTFILSPLPHKKRYLI